MFKRYIISLAGRGEAGRNDGANSDDGVLAVPSRRYRQSIPSHQHTVISFGIFRKKVASTQSFESSPKNVSTWLRYFTKSKQKDQLQHLYTTRKCKLDCCAMMATRRSQSSGPRSSPRARHKTVDLNPCIMRRAGHWETKEANIVKSSKHMRSLYHSSSRHSISLATQALVASQTRTPLGNQEEPAQTNDIYIMLAPRERVSDEPGARLFMVDIISHQ